MGTEAVIDSFAGFGDPVPQPGRCLVSLQLARQCFVDIHGRPVISCTERQSGWGGSGEVGGERLRVGRKSWLGCK